jgi:Tat protein translocase TatB subunit
MFDIGLQELIVIFTIAILIFGPKRLPELAKTLGKGLGELKRAFQDVKEQVETEFEETNKKLDNDTGDNKVNTADQKTNNNQPTDSKPV